MKHVSHTVRDVEDLRGFLTSPEVTSAAGEATSILVQIFTADTALDWVRSVSEVTSNCLPKAVVVGATTVGEVADGRTLTGQTVVGVSFFATSTVAAISVPCLPGHEHKAGLRLARELDRIVGDIAGVLLLATPLSIDAATFFNGLDLSQRRYPIFGGGAGDYAAMERSAVFSGEEVLTTGAVAVVLSGRDLTVDIRTYLGWRPLSKEMTITEAHGMTVTAVDDRPAFDVYSRYLGIPNDDDFFLNILEFPFLIERNGRTVARVPVAVDAEGGIQFVADVLEGETFRIGYGDPSLILADAKGIHQSAQAFSPQAVFLYTCGCRRFLMQEDVALETEPFETLAPTFGFYTYGEFLGTAGETQVLNSTMVAVSLREGPPPEAVPHLPAAAEDAKDEHDPYANKHARIISRLVHFIDASTRELEQANREITHLSATDRLTGLHNRLKLDAMLDETMTLAERYQQPFSVILLDIDHFKLVNDVHGHLVGDDVLVRIARLLQNAIRDVDTLGRWGGEEFMLILPHTGLQQAQIVAEKLRRVMSEKSLPIVGAKTGSFGVTTYTNGDTLENLLLRADQALYQSKNLGRNRVSTIAAP